MHIDEHGLPIKFCISPGSTADIEGLKLLPCDLPRGAALIGGKAYTNYSLEDGLAFNPKENRIGKDRFQECENIFMQ